MLTFLVLGRGTTVSRRELFKRCLAYSISIHNFIVPDGLFLYLQTFKLIKNKDS